MDTDFEIWWDNNKGRIRLVAISMEEYDLLKGLAQDAWKMGKDLGAVELLHEIEGEKPKPEYNRAKEVRCQVK